MLHYETATPTDVNEPANAQAAAPDAKRLTDTETGKGYALIAAFVGAMYSGIVGTSLKFSNTVLPLGDPFTYTNGFFVLLNQAQNDYWAGLKMAFNANWYWGMNLPIVLLSPILIKEPFSLSIVNFIVYGLATATFFRLARYLGYNLGFSIVVSLFPWLYPINFGFIDYTSIPVVALDAMFMGLLITAVANLLVFAVNPFTLRNALLAGISTGVAIWGRGNSVLVVGMVAFCPVLIAAHKVWRSRSRAGWRNLVIFAVIPVATTTMFFLKQGGPIATYYYGHLQFVERHTWNLNDALPYLKNVPGFFFWRVENSWLTIILTWFFHALIAASPFVVWRMTLDVAQRSGLRILVVSGAFIYFVTYIANIVLFTDPLMNIYNALLIYGPMRIGMTVCGFATLGALVASGKVHVGRWVIMPAMAAVLVFGVSVTKLQTPKPVPGAPTAIEVEAFAKSLDTILNGGSLSVLWYRHYSPSILRYYRVKNDLPALNIYMDRYYNEIWQQYIYTEEKRMMVREEIRNHFEKASLIIIPEYVDEYGLGNPYSFYQFRDEFPLYLNSPECPRLVVRVILQELDARLLVLQREEDAHGQGEPLKLPYGPTTQPHEDYGAGVVRFSS